MDGLKGIAEVVEHVLYETLGLLIPGAAFAIALAAAAGGDWWHVLMRVAGEHPWLALGGAYVLGYPIQGISRPVTTFFEWLLRLPGRTVVRAVLWLIPKRARKHVEDALATLERWLTSRHAHQAADPDGVVIDLRSLEADYWRWRLGLAAEEQLTQRQVQDLSFSALLPERHQLDRFRSAASLARGTAVAVASAFAILFVDLLIGAREPTTLMTLALMGLPIGFYGLVQRADMYDRLWREIIPPQLLCTVTQQGPLPGRGKAVVPAVTQLVTSGEYDG